MERKPPDFAEDEDALIASVEAWERAILAKPPRDQALALGIFIGFQRYDARWLAIEARRAERRAAHEASFESRAMDAWLAMLERARELEARGGASALLDGPWGPRPAPGSGGAKNTPVEKAPESVVATPEAILLSGRKRRGEVVDLPSDPVARAILRAGQRRRSEKEDPPT
jgi:hypothetical protein